MGILKRLLKKINKSLIDDVDRSLRLWYGYRLIEETDNEVSFYKFIPGDCEYPSVRINVHLYNNRMKIDVISDFINTIPGSRSLEEQISLFVKRMRLKWK